MTDTAIPDGITIRKQEPPDLPAIQALIETAWQSGELAGRSRRDIERWIERLPQGNGATWVALAGETLAGMESDTWCSVIVAPAWHR
jgi:N-acetylglutamate synthase-like GNAT family acetyltransferase